LRATPRDRTVGVGQHLDVASSFDDTTIEELLAEGFRREPVGDELEPVRSFVFVPAERAGRITERRELEVRLSPELLAASNLVLVAFDLA
jgi:hypothetical protein